MKACSNVCVALLLFVAPLSAASVPAINSGGILNGAGFSLVSRSLAPGSIAAIFGANLSDGTVCVSPSCGPSFDANGKVLPTLAGAQVTFNSFPAPILSTPGPTQLNVQVPMEVAGATSATVVVTVNGQKSAPTTVPLAPLGPGLISLNASGSGQGAILNDKDANKGIQSLAAPSGSVPNAHAALPGDVIEIYATGLGVMTPPVGTGMQPHGLPQTVTMPIVIIGWIPAQVNFSGLASCCVGLNQINVTIPPGVAPGYAVPLWITIGGYYSNTVVIAVGGTSTASGDCSLTLQGTASSLSGSVPGACIANFSFGGGLPNPSVTGNMSVSLTGVSSPNDLFITQTVYSGTVSGSGTMQCANGSTGNWTASFSLAITVSPSVVTALGYGGNTYGSYSFPGSGNSVAFCGSPQAFAGLLTSPDISGSVGLGGLVMVTARRGIGVNAAVLQGTAQSISGTVPGTLYRTATGSVSFSATGVSSGSQTFYSRDGNGSGTVSCAKITGSGTTSNWTASVSATITLSPAIPSLAASGGTVSGTFVASFSVTACGSTTSGTATGAVTGSVSPGGATTLTLTATGGNYASSNGRGTKAAVLQGTAQSISGTVPATLYVYRTATGSLPFSATGVSSGSQTFYYGGGSGSGTIFCYTYTSTGIVTTPGNWAASGSATITISPSVTSLAASGGSVSGTFLSSVSVVACGSPVSGTVTGTVTGSVSPGGSNTLTLTATGGSYAGNLQRALRYSTARRRK